MTDTKAVLEKLLSDHVGRENSITQTQLSDALGMNKSTLRSELRNLRQDEGIPIGNLRNGYFVIGDEEEFREYIGHINKEIKSKKQTIEATTSAYQEFDPPENPEDMLSVTYECSKCEESVTKENKRYPHKGDYKGELVCKSCLGKLIMKGKA